MRFSRRQPTALIATLALSLAVCAREAAPPDPVIARFGERTLTAETLARWMVLGQPMPLESDVAEELAIHWLELTVFDARLAAGDSLGGDAWRTAMVEAIRDSVIATDRAGRFPDLAARVAAETEQLARTDRARLIAHVLRRADAGTRAAERELQRLSAERIRARLVAGGTWAEANAENEDEASRDNAGVIGIIRGGDLPEPLAGAVTALAPGGVSAIVESGFGFHILHRPRIEGEWRDRLAALVRAELVARADSMTAQSLVDDARVRFPAQNIATVRALAREPWRSAWRPDTIAVWVDGAVTAGDVARSLAFLPARARRALIAADDREVSGFAFDIVVRELLGREAERRGAAPDAGVLAGIEAAFRAQIRVVADRLASAGSAADGLRRGVRDELRRFAVDRHLEAVVARRTTMDALPPLLVVQMLEGQDWMLDPDAIRAALDRARQLMATAGVETNGGAGR